MGGPADGSTVESTSLTHLSVSQCSAYEECPAHFYLARRLKAWTKPAAWFGMGTGVHAAVEAFEKSGRSMTPDAMEAVFVEAYLEDVNAELERVPNGDWWFASGQYGGYADIERRMGIGKRQTAQYWDWAMLGAGQDELPWTTQDGTLAVELPFDVDIGGVKVRGHIDQVVEVRPPAPRTKSGALAKSKAALADWQAQPLVLRVRDVKTGSMVPTDPLQLMTYKLALESTYGVSVPQGDYWLGKNGGPGKTKDLTLLDPYDIERRYQAARAGIDREDWTPNPDKDCSRCEFVHELL